MGSELKIMRSEPDWVSRLRLLGKKSLTEQPYEKNPLYVKNYEQLSLDPEWILENTEPRSDASIPKEYADLSSFIDEPIIIHVDAAPVRTFVPPRLSEMGLELMSLEEALRSRPELVKQALMNGPSRPDEEKLLGLLYASLNSGVLVRVPSRFEEPVSIRSIWICGGGTATSAATIIYAGDGTRLTMTEEYYSYGDSKPGFLGHLVHVYEAPESQVRHVVVNDASEKHEVVAYKRAVLSDYASHKWIGVQLGGSLTKAKIDNYMDGEGTRTDTLEASMLSGTQRLDMTINLLHEGKSTTGRVIAKSVGMQNSRTILKGIIKIERKAKNSTAYLAEHAMLLSSQAKAEAIPGLEIECNEVRATHSASIAQIDQDQVWYIMSRGLPREEAVKLLVLGFFEPLISEVDQREIRWNMRYLLEKKWVGREIDPESLIDVYVEPEEVGKSPEDIFGKHYKYIRRRA